MRFERYELTEGGWDGELARLPGGFVCQTEAWLSFLRRSQQGEPVAALLYDEAGSVVGAFAGMIVVRFGLRILGSPFPGWTTPYMGITLAHSVSRVDAMHALVRFAFRDLDCVHLEMMDRHLVLDDLTGLRSAHRMFNTWEVDLRSDPDELLATFSRSCRTKIRQAMRGGLVVEEASGQAFVDEYYAQLSDVFGRQHLVPTYPKQRVEQLIASVPSDKLLLLRATTGDGRPAATGVFHAVDDRRVYGWGYASWRSMQSLHPNELLMFHAMNAWRERGYSILDLAGEGDYKRRYHPTPVAVPWVRISRYRVIGPLRAAAERSLRLKRSVSGRLGARTLQPLQPSPEDDDGD